MLARARISGTLKKVKAEVASEESQSLSNTDDQGVPLDFNSIEFLNSFSENAVNVL